MAKKQKLRLYRMRSDYKDDLDQVLASAGAVVEVVRSERDDPEWKWECSAGRPNGGMALFCLSDKQLRQLTTRIHVPENRFANEESFRIGLLLDTEETIRQLMERKVDEWLEDGRGSAAGCLTRWAMDELNLGSIETLVGIAENQFDEAS